MAELRCGCKKEIVKGEGYIIAGCEHHAEYKGKVGIMLVSISPGLIQVLASKKK